MNFPHNKKKINSVLLMMSLKLTIKVVAFFLVHPVYVLKILNINNNNMGNLYCVVPILIYMYSTSHYIHVQHHLHIITPALVELPMGAQKHYKEWIPAGYPFTTPGSRETIVDKMPCLRAYAPSGIRTHDPLITSREHEPLHHSAPTNKNFINNRRILAQ